ncbi:MAG: hypothetical protein KF914_18865 [Rhizobiaceae bacterium]|nr:hypothetical protein [Rhizobiaceae bacterium]
MAEQADNLVLEHLRHIRRAVDEMQTDIVDLKARMTGVEGSLGQITSQIGHLQTQIASQTLRIDRFDERMARIERRLDLVEA